MPFIAMRYIAYEVKYVHKYIIHYDAFWVGDLLWMGRNAVTKL